MSNTQSEVLVHSNSHSRYLGRSSRKLDTLFQGNRERFETGSLVGYDSLSYSKSNSFQGKVRHRGGSIRTQGRQRLSPIVPVEDVSELVIEDDTGNRCDDCAKSMGIDVDALIVQIYSGSIGLWV